jgi:hypothetical protein
VVSSTGNPFFDELPENHPLRFDAENYFLDTRANRNFIK